MYPIGQNVEDTFLEGTKTHESPTAKHFERQSRPRFPINCLKMILQTHPKQI